MAYAGMITQSDTLTGLVDALFTGYADLPDIVVPADLPKAALTIRTAIAEDMVMTLRDIHATAAAHAAGVDLADKSIQELAREAVSKDVTTDPAILADVDAMMGAHPSFPVLPGAAWELSLPVVAVTSSYATPDGYLPLPTGNVILIDPTTDSTLLRSLQSAGVLQFGELPPDESALAPEGALPGWDDDPV